MLNGTYHILIEKIGGNQVITKAKHPGPELGISPYALMSPIESPYMLPIAAQKITKKSSYDSGEKPDKQTILTLADFPLTSYTGEALY